MHYLVKTQEEEYIYVNTKREKNIDLLLMSRVNMIRYAQIGLTVVN